MTKIEDRKHYVLEWETIFENLNIKKFPLLKKYIDNLYSELKYFEESVTTDNVWNLFPKFIGVDSKLNIIQSLLKAYELASLKETQILEIVENDYLSYTKESFGFKLNERTNFSLLFNVK